MKEAAHKGRLKRVPKTGSRKFPKVYTLFGRLVGITHTGSLKKERGVASVFLMPVSEKKEAWPEFDVPLDTWDKRRGLNFENDYPDLKNGSERPVLANAGIILRPDFGEDEGVPQEVREQAKGERVASLHYGINQRFMDDRRYFKGKPPLVRKGIGTTLVAELEERAKKDGVGFLFAHTTPGNRASISLLEAQGYTRHPEKVWFDHPPNFHERAYILYKKL